MSIIKERTEKIETRIYVPKTRKYILQYLDVIFKVYQKNDMINKDEYQYLHLIDSILNTGIETSTRNGTVKSLFAQKMTFDLTRFPLLTTKKVGYKTILRELLWFIKGSTDNQELQDKNVHIWDGNASKVPRVED